MAVTCDELLAGAEELLASATSEVMWRSASSLAYYAAFHRCIALAQHELPGGVSPRIGHRPLVDALMASSTLRLRSIAIILNQCRVRRQQADYLVDADFTKDTATSVLSQCGRIFAKADRRG